MRQRIVLALILLVCISISFGYVRRSMYELYTNTGCGPCTPANDYLDDNYYMYVDQVNLVRFHVSWPSSGDPFYVVNPSQPSDRRVYYSITGVPKAIVNGRSLSSWSGSITTAVAEAGTYTPLELEMSVMDSGLCHIEVICNDPSYDNTLSLVCVLNEDTYIIPLLTGKPSFSKLSDGCFRIGTERISIYLAIL